MYVVIIYNVNTINYHSANEIYFKYLNPQQNLIKKTLVL